MPAPLVKGQSAFVLSATLLRHDPATDRTSRVFIYEGTPGAIQGQFNRHTVGTRNPGEVMADLRDGAGRLEVSKPIGAFDEQTTRFEIFNEFIERDIFSIPAVMAEMAAYDASPIGSTYRKLAEDFAQETITTPTPNAGTFPLFQQVVRALKSGTTGYEREYIGLRRSRSVPRGFADKANILDGNLIYTTAELALPGEVEFNVPDSTTLAAIPDFIWGWRRRPSSSVYEGVFCLQTSEFILAPWTTLAYALAGTEADW